MTNEPIIAIGLLSRRDLDCLGETFRGAIPIAEDANFDDLLTQLDTVELARSGQGLIVRSRLTPKTHILRNS